MLTFRSAGVGRTGTLIAIDRALAQAAKERQVDIPKIIVDMRKQRMKMVQTAVSLLVPLDCNHAQAVGRPIISPLTMSYPLF